MKKKVKPIKVVVVEKKKMTPEQIEARKRATLANAADEVFNIKYST